MTRKASLKRLKKKEMLLTEKVMTITSPVSV